MAKRIKGLEVETEYMEYAVEYDLNGETFVTEPVDDEGMARLMRCALYGRVLTRYVFETAWADASDV